MPFLLSLLSILNYPPASAPVAWTFASIHQDNGSVTVEMLAVVDAGWHMYATELPSEKGPVATSIRFKPSTQYAILGELQEPEPVEEYDPNFDMVVRHHSGSVRFTMPIKPAVSGTIVVEGEVEYMVCNDKTCLPPKVVPFKLIIPAIVP